MAIFHRSYTCFFYALLCLSLPLLHHPLHAEADDPLQHVDIDLETLDISTDISTAEDAFSDSDVLSERSWYTTVKDNVSQYACEAWMTYFKAKRMIQNMLPF